MKLLPIFLLTTGFCLPAPLKLGNPLTLKEPVSVGQIASAPETYVGKTVQVKGKVTEVCQMMGCWMNLADPETGKLVKIKVDDGDLVFPKESVGKMAIAEGKLVKFELTREQATEKAKHEAEEQGRKFNPNSIKSGATIYQIQGTGAMVLE
jgi:hypothetical protein